MLILILVFIVVCFIAFWWKWWENPTSPNDNLSWDELTQNGFDHTLTETSWDFEQDVMNDLESYFHDSNGYENIEWEFWFIDSDAQN